MLKAIDNCDGQGVQMVEMTPEEVAAYQAEQAAALAPPKDVLEAYAVSARWQKTNAGILFNGAPYPTDVDGRTFVAGAYAKALADPAVTKRWQVSNTPITFITLDAAALIALGLAFDAYVQSTFDKLDEVAIAIEGGTITTKAQIDAAFASVSQVFTG